MLTKEVEGGDEKESEGEIERRVTGEIGRDDEGGGMSRSRQSLWLPREASLNCW